MGDALSKLSIRQTGLPLSADEPNNGIIPNLSFDPVDQYVNVSPGSPNECKYLSSLFPGLHTRF